MYNKLPDEVVQTSTISVFKACLQDSYWLEIGHGHCEMPIWPNYYIKRKISVRFACVVQSKGLATSD